MPLQKFKCVDCGKEFDAGSWECFPGHQHRVELKRYYMTDAPLYKEDCKYSRTMVTDVIPERQETRGNDIIRVPGTHCEFVRGLYETDNPQLQFGLDTRKNIFSGPEGQKRWEGAYLSKEEKTDMEAGKLRSEMSRLQSENNALLAQIQENVGKARKTA